MLAALDEHMPDLKGLSWTRPEGGLFLWVRLPKGMDAEQLFYEAIEQEHLLHCFPNFVPGWLQHGDTPEIAQPALRAPIRLMTYSGMFGRLIPTTSPFTKPFDRSILANWLAY